MIRDQSSSAFQCVLALVTCGLALALSGCAQDDQAAKKATRAEPEVTRPEPPQGVPARASETAAPVPPGKGISVPSFDVVRVDRNGDGVIAGRAEPGWKVAIETDGSAIATVVADRDGEWAAVLRRPLPPGDHALVLRAHSPDGMRGLVSDQTVMVSVAKDRRQEAAVALSTPGRPTEVLQTEQPADEPSASRETTGSLQSAAPSTPGRRIVAAAKRQVPIASARPAPRGESEVKTRRFRAVPTTGDGETRRMREKAVSPEGAAASVESHDDPRVAFDAVDYEQTVSGTGRVYMTGSAKPAARLLIYINNEPVGEAIARGDGRWAFSGAVTLMLGSHEMRADHVVEGRRVVSRAEVEFARTAPGAIAAADAESPPAEDVPPARSNESSPANATAAPAERKTRVAVAKPTGPRATIASRRTPAARKPRKKVKKRRTKRRRKPRRRNGRRVVVVERGDTLWQIARSIFGRGDRYTTIYRRNRRQIRDPNRIYPRQRLRVKRR